jgi:site-specific DNA recombinase
MDTAPLNGHKRAVIYCRVSTEEQAGNYSLSTQLEACRKYAEQHGLIVVADFADDYSGATPIEARPHGREAFTLLKSSETDCLIAFSIDRIARPPEDGDEWDTPLLIRGLAKLGKGIHTVNRGELKTDFAGLLIAMLDARSAGDERRKIIERTQRGRRAKADAGRVVGGGSAPYGYQFKYTLITNPKTGKKKNVVTGLAIDEAEAAIVREIYRWYTVDLLTGHEIAKRLSERHVPTPGEARGYKRKRQAGAWRHNAVYAILKSEVYCGVWQYGKYDYNGVKHGSAKRKKRAEGEAIDVQVRAIVSRQTWEKAQQRRNSGGGVSKRRYLYLLAGRIKCGCGYTLTGCANSKYGLRYYRCGSLAHQFKGIEERTCFERPIKADVLECIAWDFALQAKKSAAEFIAMLKDYQEQQQTDLAPLAGQISAAKELIETAGRKIRRLASLRGSATDDEEAGQYTNDLEAAKEEKAGLHRKLKKLEANYRWEDALTDDDIIAVLKMREADLQSLQKATFEDMRRYLAKIDLRVEVKDRIATITCKLPVPAKIIDLGNRDESCASCSTASILRGHARGSRRCRSSAPAPFFETQRRAALPGRRR